MMRRFVSRVQVWLLVMLVGFFCFAGLAQAQVASVCGPGKKCTTAGYRNTSGFAMCDMSTNADWGWYATTSNLTLASFAAKSGCAGALVSRLNVNVNDAIVRSAATGGFGAGTQGFQASASLASFPAAASSAGVLLYDSTNAVWRYSNGAVWAVVSQEQTLTPYFPAALGLVTDAVISQTRMQQPGSVARVGATVLTGGTGGGNYTVEVYNVTAAATICTRTIPCVAGAGSTSIQCASNGYASAADVAVRITTAACATAPSFNASISLVGGW